MVYQCAPHVRAQGNSCYSLKNLQDMARAYNQKYPSTPIRNHSQMNRDQLWEAFNKRLQHKCSNDESCWIEQDFALHLDSDEPLDRFKPRRPKGQYTWLSTSDIRNVMEQYALKHKNFQILGPVPLNYSRLSDDLVDEVKNIDLAKLQRQGKDCVGIVFNLSPWHPGQVNSGSHWVALWIDMKKRLIGYYDSYGSQAQTARNQVHIMPLEIKKLVDDIVRRYPNYRVVENTVQAQYKDADCGTYVLYFLYQALQGQDLQSIFNNPVPDDQMNELRRKFFFRDPK